MLKKTILTALLATLTFVSSAQAFRIEGANWGDSRDQIIEKLKQKGWAMRPSRVEQMVQADAFLVGDACVVQFMFNRSLKLNKIRVQWDTPETGKEAKNVLTNRYGNPHVSNAYTKHFEWHGAFSGEEITLDYADQMDLQIKGTTVVFDGGEAYR